MTQNQNVKNSAEFVSKMGHVLKVTRISGGKTLKYSGPYEGQPAEITTLNCTLERFLEQYTREGSYYTMVNSK